MEKCVAQLIQDHMESNNLLMDYQHGFREARGASTALLTACEDWQKSKDGNESSAVAFFDLSAAFDCLEADILGEKLSLYGASRVARNLMIDYLENRSQIVSIDGHESMPLKLPVGTPQGSMISPQFYCTYVNDLKIMAER